MASKPKAKKPAGKVDWDGVHREFRANQLSIPTLAKLYKTSCSSIWREAKKGGWKRDLTQTVAESIRTRLMDPEANAADERQAVEQATDRGVEVVMGHRQDISAGRAAFSVLMTELSIASQHHDELLQAIHAGTSEDRKRALLKSVNLPSRATTLMNLTSSLKTLIALERQAFNIDGTRNAATDLESFLAEISGKPSSSPMARLREQYGE